MNKKQLIEKYLTEPLKEGEDVNVKWNETDKNSLRAKVKSVKENSVVLSRYDYKDEKEFPINVVKKITLDIGADPFGKELNLKSLEFSLESVMARIGFDTYTKEFNKKDRADFSPKAFGEDYQRGLEWSLEQKQDLIHSIFNHMTIGRFLVRDMGIDRTLNAQARREEAFFYQIVDGKQRLMALIDFFQGKFDVDGILFSELSSLSQHKFRNYSKLSYAEMGENTTDAEVLEAFLKVNNTGVPVSKEHLSKVEKLLSENTTVKS